MLCFDAGESFCEGVSCHIVSRAIDQVNVAFLNDETNIMVADVDVLGMCMKASILRKHNGCLAVTVVSSRVCERLESRVCQNNDLTPDVG
jgi:hypothetical protein